MDENKTQALKDYHDLYIYIYIYIYSAFEGVCILKSIKVF